MSKVNKLYEFIEEKVRERTHCRKKALIELIISEYDIEKLDSEETVSDKIEDWIKLNPAGYNKLKASDFEKKFNIKIYAGIGNKVNGNEMIYYYANAFDKNQILYAKKLIDEKQRFDLATNIIVCNKSFDKYDLKLFNINETYELFNLLNPDYPILFTKLVLDALIGNIKKQEYKIPTNKKEELIEKIDSFYLKYYKSLDLYVKNSPDFEEYNKTEKEIQGLMAQNPSDRMYNYDFSKNTPLQQQIYKLSEKKALLFNKIEDYKREIEIKKNIRYKLIELIALLKDKKKVYEYLITDLDNFIPYIKKNARNCEETNKLYIVKGIAKPTFDCVSGDTKIDNARDKQYLSQLDVISIYNVIINSYSQGIVRLFLNIPENNKAKLLYDYENYNPISEIITKIFS